MLALCYGKEEKWQAHIVYRRTGHGHCKGRQKFLGEGGPSAPAAYNVPEGLCCGQKQKKSDSSFSIKFAIKRHGASVIVFFHCLKMHGFHFNSPIN